MEPTEATLRIDVDPPAGCGFDVEFMHATALAGPPACVVMVSSHTESLLLDLSSTQVNNSTSPPVQKRFNIS